MIYSVELDSNLINNFQKVLKESGGDEANIVTKMLKKIYEAFNFDFTKDLELRIALIQHLMPLRIRVKFDMKMKNLVYRIWLFKT